ncbi:MAG: hypothetical protein ACKO04_06805 [Actinomycetes bacterium]
MERSATPQPREGHGTVAPWARRARLGLVLAATVLAAACSRDQGARPPVVTTQEDPAETTTSSPPPPSRRPGPSTTVDPAEPLELVWVRQVGGLGNDELSSVAGRDDSVVAVGSTDGAAGPTQGGRDAMVVVARSSGTVAPPTQFGTDGTDRAAGVAATGGTALACGTSDSTRGTRSSGTPDGWCAPVADDGTLGEAVAIGGDADDSLVAVALPRPTGSGPSDDDRPAPPTFGYAVGSTSGVMPRAQDPSGRGLGDGDAVVTKVDPSGQPLWIRQFGSFAPDRATGVTTSEGGDAVAVGVTGGDAAGRSLGGTDGFVARFDPAGNQRWAVQVGSSGDDELRAVAAAGEARRGTEQFIVGGSTGGLVGAASAGGADALVVALGPDGRQQWATQFGSAGTDRVTAVLADGATVLVAGTTDAALGTLRADLGPGGRRDAFVAALDAESGQVLWTSRFGAAEDDDVTGLTTTEDGLLVLSGATAGQLPGATTLGNVDGLLVAFRLPGSGVGAASSV